MRGIALLENNLSGKDFSDLDNYKTFLIQISSKNYCRHAENGIPPVLRTGPLWLPGSIPGVGD